MDCDTFCQSVACKMSWMFGRETTRIEDMAYCLIRIFNINMPLLYGEGIYAFHRLQQEIVKVSDDETIFAWRASSSTAFTWRSLFADHPHEFANSGHLIPHRRKASADHETTVDRRLQIQLSLIERDSEETDWNSGTEYTAILSCHPGSEMSRPRQIGIFIKRIFANEYVRVDVDRFVLIFQPTVHDHYQKKNKRISVRHRLDYEPWWGCITCFRICGMMIKNTSQNAQLSDVQTDNLWNKTTNVITFTENDMRAGRTQRANCIFSTGIERSSVLLSFDPQATYDESCCEFTLGSKDSFHAYHVQSHIRLISHEAMLVVIVEAWW